MRSTDGIALLTAQKINGLYALKASTIYTPPAQTSADLLQDWLHRLGHLNVRDVMRLERASRLGDSLGHVYAAGVSVLSARAVSWGRADVYLVPHMRTMPQLP
jgi:hypothetical protein